MNTAVTPTPATTDVSFVRQLLWLVRRELWEMRSIYLAPAAVAVLVAIMFLIRAFSLPGHMKRVYNSPVPDLVRLQEIREPYVMASLLIMATTFVLALYYCMDALYGERRDRSILFWKSLPVSDGATVLSKAAIPFVVLPLVTLFATMAAHIVMLLIHSAALAASGHGLEILNGLGLIEFWIRLLHHFLAIHSLWFAPFYGWLLMVSAWSKRSPLVWAFLPPITIGVLEKIAFDTTHFRDMVRYRIMGAPGGDAFMTSSESDPVGHVHNAAFFTDPGLWTGFLFTALCLFAATRLRRYRGPSV